MLSGCYVVTINRKCDVITVEHYRHAILQSGMVCYITVRHDMLYYPSPRHDIVLSFECYTTARLSYYCPAVVLQFDGLCYITVRHGEIIL